MTIEARQTKSEYITEFLPYSIHNPDGFPRLTIDEVHLWRADLNLQTPHLNYLVALLSDRERDWAKHVPVEENRQQALAAHGLLRIILGRYLAYPPTALRFFCNPHSQPYLAIGPGRPPLHFNLAYSQGIAIYIFALGRRVGVDLELIRTDFDYDQIAEDYFSARERAVLGEFPAQDKHRAFFACWTRREAYSRATDQNFSLPVHHIDGPLRPERPAPFLKQGNPTDLTAWSVQEIIPGPGYVGAVAVEGHDWRLRCWR